MGFTYSDFLAARTITWETPSRVWRFRSVHGIPMKEQAELSKKLEVMTVADVLAFLASLEGMDVTPEQIDAELSDTEQAYIVAQVQKKIKLGE